MLGFEVPLPQKTWSSALAQLEYVFAKWAIEIASPPFGPCLLPLGFLSISAGGVLEIVFSYVVVFSFLFNCALRAHPVVGAW